jgi:hypothetical protein
VAPVIDDLLNLNVLQHGSAVHVTDAPLKEAEDVCFVYGAGLDEDQAACILEQAEGHKKRDEQVG